MKALRLGEKGRTVASHKLLITSQRAFDAEMLRSAVRVYNTLAHRLQPQDNALVTGEIPSREHAEFRTSLRHEFSWVPQVLAEKAESIGISQGEVKWNGDGDLDPAFDMIGTLIHTAYGKLLAKTYPDVQQPPPWYDREEFPDSFVIPLPVHARYVFWKKRRVIDMVAFPSLTTSELCAKYVLVTLGANAWGLASRIRICAFRRPDKVHHFFLAQVGANGALMPGYPQRFCSSEHSNAHRQQKYRRNHSAPRKPK